MPFRPDEEESKLTIKLTNTERVGNLPDAQAGEDNVINNVVAIRFEAEDFTSNVKMKLGQYLECEIRDEAAQSQARLLNKPPRPRNLVNHDPNEISNAGPNSYMANQTQPTKTAFETVGNSGQFKFNVSIKKREVANDDNKDPEAQILRTRIGMYSNVNEVGKDSVLALAVENLVDRNARFSSKEGDTPYVGPNNQSETTAGTKSHVFYSGFGSHPGEDFTLPSDLDTNVETEVSIEQLRDLGLRILMQASGEVFIPEDTSTGQIAAARGVTTAVPGISRLGLRQRFGRFSATELLNKVNPDAQKATVDIDLQGPSNPTYGNVNNPLVPFSAISSATSSVIVSSLLVLTVSAIFQSLAELFSVGSNNLTSPIGSLSDPSLDEGADTVKNRRRRLGSFLVKEDDQASPGSTFVGALSNITGFNNLLADTQPFKYSNCVARGLEIFFGIRTSGTVGAILGGSIEGATSSVIEASGYWNTILRNIIKSITDPILTISNGIANVDGTNIDATALERTAYDIDSLIGPNTDPFALLEVVNLIKDSRLLKVMNIIATMGKIDLATNLNSSNTNVNISSIDSIKDVTTVGYDGEGASITGARTGLRRINPASLVRKNRLSNLVIDAGGTPGALAWGTSTVPSLYLQTTNIIVAEELYAGEAKNMTTVRQLLKKDMVKPQNQGRIDANLVRQIEDELESYYVPFYFHDLRTNEIVAFHAFINSMSDSFNTEYSETQGYGRIGNVYTYKNTTRSISISFKIVATNKSDFDQMWYKINKILMYCFPQYTLGRQVSYENSDGGTYNFIQPFSQLPGSSPVIRLRIGDVFKSNYSDFDLARLHGIGEKFATPSISDPDAIQLNEESQSRIEEEAATILNRLKRYEFQSGDKFILNTSLDIPTNIPISPYETNGLVIRAITSTIGGTTATPGAPPTIETPTDGRIRITPGQIFTVGRFISGKIYQVTKENTGDEDSTLTLEIDFSRINPGDTTTIGFEDNFVYSQARLQAKVEQNDLVASVTSQVRTEVNDFFEANGTTEANTNPIFKAFNSVRGEGIPGVIKSINFDWNDAIWETEALNSRAPKWVSVQMEFAPIFDINPGLDSNGEMIGAIYNVGDIMQKLKINRQQAINNESKRMNFVQRKSQAKTKFENS